MSRSIHRRQFLKVTGATSVGFGLAGLTARRAVAAQLANGAPHAEKLGWLLGCQAYSFNRYSLYEAIDNVRALGLHTIEAYPGQKLSQQKPDAKIDPSMSPALRKELKQRLADAGVQMPNYGVCGLVKDEATSRKTFEFAKTMGIETIVSEPPLDAFDTLEKLCDEYAINVALHNHPKPSRYWNPDTVLKACKGRSHRIGACADTGHWMRSGLNPIEELKKLEGRIISFHFKDLNKYGKDAHDVPWGTGKGNVKGMLAEIHRQGVKGVFSIEYEYHWTSSLPEIAQSIRYFDQVAAELA
jgi:sugar phosphate isomerase/epimerase